jgi:hypothetical protein
MSTPFGFNSVVGFGGTPIGYTTQGMNGLGQEKPVYSNGGMVPGVGYTTYGQQIGTVQTQFAYVGDVKGIGHDNFGKIIGGEKK